MSNTTNFDWMLRLERIAAAQGMSVDAFLTRAETQMSHSDDVPSPQISSTPRYYESLFQYAQHGVLVMNGDGQRGCES